MQTVRAFTDAVPAYDELPGIVTERIAVATGDLCAIRLLSDDGLRLVPVAGAHPDPAVRADAWEVMLGIERLGADAWLPAIRERRVVRLRIDPMQPPPDVAPAQSTFMRKHRARSLVVVPLIARGTVLGGLSLMHLGSGQPHTDAEVRFLLDVAERAALAIDNARLVRDLRQRDDRLEAANSELRARLTHLHTLTVAGRAFAARTLDVHELGKAICEQVATAVGDACTLWFPGAHVDGDPLVLSAARHRDPTVSRLMNEALEPVLPWPTDRLRSDSQGMPDTSRVRVMRLSSDDVKAALRPVFRDHPALVVPAIALVAVLRARNRDLGLLVASREASLGPYSASDEALLGDLGDRAALALDNARLYAAAQARLAERERAEALLRTRAEQQVALTQLGRAALEGVDLPTLFDTALDLAANVLDVNRAAVLLLPDSSGELQVGAARGWGDELPVTGAPLEAIGLQVKQTLYLREPVVFPEAGSRRVPRNWRMQGLLSGVAVVIPGKLGLAPRGALAVHRTHQRHFTAEDVAFLEGVANVLGAGIAHKESEEATFRREEEFRALVENTPDIISRFDRELRRIYVNPAIEHATGQPASTYIGRTNRELNTPLLEQWERVASQVFRTGREQTLKASFETPIGEREYETRVTPEFASDGTVASVLTVARDVTDIRKAERARTELVQEVLQREARLQELVSRMLANHAQDARRAMRSMEIDRLTRRERDILKLVVAGQTNGEIAHSLGLAVGTVKNHVARLLPKLGAVDRTQAAVRAVESGFLDTQHQ